MSLSVFTKLITVAMMSNLRSVWGSDFAEDFANCVQDSNSLNPCLHQVKWSTLLYSIQIHTQYDDSWATFVM